MLKNIIQDFALIIFTYLPPKEVNINLRLKHFLLTQAWLAFPPMLLADTGLWTKWQQRPGWPF